MRALALFAALLLIGVAAITAAAEDPRGSEFINSVGGGSFAFPSTTKGWEVSGSAVDGTKPARTIRVDREPNQAASDPLTRQGVALLWAKRCTVERQRLVLERDVYVAGPEYKLGAGLDFSRGTESAFRSGRILVNGVQVLKVDAAGGGFDQTPKRPRAFRFGHNKIEVIVVKRPNNRDRRCNVAGTPPHLKTGVRWNVFGEFGSDIEALPARPSVIYKRLEEGKNAVAFRMAFGVRNNGPGGLARGTLSVRMSLSFPGELGTILRLGAADPQVQSCKATPPAGDQSITREPRDVLCTIANLRSGATAEQPMELIFQMPPNGARNTLSLRYFASGSELPWIVERGKPPPPEATNNERSSTVVFCRYEDTECPAGPPESGAIDG